MNIREWAIETINLEKNTIEKLIPYIDADFESAVQAIYSSKGKIIATGVGKSAIIAEKIVATLNSTGTPAVFMHAVDAIHGDLGVVAPDDLVLCLSKSGNTPEIKVLVPLIRNMGNRIISLVSTPASYLEEHADYRLSLCR